MRIQPSPWKCAFVCRGGIKLGGGGGSKAEQESICMNSVDVSGSDQFHLQSAESRMIKIQTTLLTVFLKTAGPADKHVC